MKGPRLVLMVWYLYFHHLTLVWRMLKVMFRLFSLVLYAGCGEIIPNSSAFLLELMARLV